MLHAQPIDWEVVESYSVDPVRVYVEDDGAAIVRLAPHQIVGDYTFDMTPPARAAQSTHSPHATRKSIDIPSKGLKSYCARRRASHSNSVPNSRSQPSRPALPERHSDPPASRSLDHESLIPRTSSPEQISDPNTPITTPEGGSPKSKRLSLSLSFLKPHRRSSSSSAESSSGASDAGTSDGESDPAPRLPRPSKRPSPPSRTPIRAPVELPAYKKSDLKRALIFARHELMKQVTQSGKNALVVEGWTVTILRQGSIYRIHIEYIGQPAIVAYPDDATPSSVPPFLEVVDR